MGRESCASPKLITLLRQGLTIVRGQKESKQDFDNALDVRRDLGDMGQAFKFSGALGQVAAAVKLVHKR